MEPRFTLNESEDQELTLTSSNPIHKVGALLKAERQKQNMSTALLAASLRIGEEQLIALEEGNNDLLPEKVFIKGMIKRISERLRINPDSLILELEGSKSNKFIDNENNNNQSSKKSILKNLTEKKIILFSLIGIGLISVIIFASKKFYDNKSQKEISYTKSMVTKKQIEKEVTISSLKPSKAKIINGLGDILFEGTINYPLKYPLSMGLEIYAYQPNLIEIKGEGMIDQVLGSNDDIKWHDITLLINQ